MKNELELLIEEYGRTSREEIIKLLEALRRSYDKTDYNQKGLVPA